MKSREQLTVIAALLLITIGTLTLAYNAFQDRKTRDFNEKQQKGLPKTMPVLQAQMPKTA